MKAASQPFRSGEAMRRDPGQTGFALVGVLGVIMVLAILCTMVYRNVNTDITHSGKDVNRVRAEFAAESAVQWALSEVARKRPGKLPFTLATHEPGGEKVLSSGAITEMGGEGQTAKLDFSDVEILEGARGGVDKDGWIYQSTSKKELSVSNAGNEILSFKVWYPNDSTLRIQGRGVVDGSASDVDLVSTIREIAVPM
ncbi:MAG: hypothetical protein JWP91_268 [Fibrobacteres bacterium]|nr:hypothetical protein [Fibrobacterota bacterium]